MDNFLKNHPRVLVVGDLMIDYYLWGRCDRISPEAPVQVVEIQKENANLGGAGNVVNNLLALGAVVDVASVIGKDDSGSFLKQVLKDKGISVDCLLEKETRITSKKTRLMAAQQQIVRFDYETKELISDADANWILEYITPNIEKYNVILLSDYAKGVLTPRLSQEIIKLAKKHHIPVLVDPKGSDYSKYKGATLITPNKKEAAIATSTDIKDEKSLLYAGFSLRNMLGLEYAIITLSEEGMAIFGKDLERVPTIAREVYDVTGAGDTVLAALGFALANGADINKAASFATSAAAVVVSKLGSATATLEEILSYERQFLTYDSSKKIVNLEELLFALNGKKNKKIVFTNGCFDILHAGHVSYLEKAKQFGDVLIVGLNSDESVKRLKGQTRPINGEDDRASVLAALKSVDFVILFKEDTPSELIKTISPNILVKGGDYADKEVVGREFVDEVRIVDFVEGKGSTSIIRRIQND